MRRYSCLAIFILSAFHFATTLASNSSKNSSTSGVHQSCGIHCGEQRWEVKTLSDEGAGDIDFNPRAHSVHWLRQRVRPHSFPATRIIGVEFQTFKVRALLVGFKKETNDNDFHVVIGDLHNPDETMIIEFPDPICSGVCNSMKLDEIKEARAVFVNAFGQPPTNFKRLNRRVVVLVTGVAFFDRFHGNQTGVARPSGLELHPVLDFEVVSDEGGR
jgi:hypothetical protein